MRRVTTKILKIIIFVGIFIWYLSDQLKRPETSFSLEMVGTGLALGALAYIGLSLFGFTLDVSQNYVIALAFTVGIALFVCFKLDGIIAAIPWLTENRFLLIIIVLTMICMIKDVMMIRTIAQIRKYNAMQAETADENQKANRECEDSDFLQ